MFVIEILPIGSAEIPSSIEIDTIPTIKPPTANSQINITTIKGNVNTVSQTTVSVTTTPAPTKEPITTITPAKNSVTTTSLSRPSTTNDDRPLTESNDNTEKIEFEQPEYSFIVDNPKQGAKVGEIKLIENSNNDGVIKFEIKPREMSNYFRIDDETREIFISNVPKGAGELQEFVFNVTVVDANNPTRRGNAEVSVTLIPEVIDFPEPSDLSIDDQIQLTSTPTTTLSSNNDNSNIQVDNNNGEDVMPSAKPINGISTSSQTVVDDDVHFASSEFKGMLPEGNYGNGGTILSLKPHPLSQGMPKDVKYHIEAFNTGNETMPFSIKENTGEIIVFGDIDRESNGAYEFIVTVTSNIDPQVQDSALIEIQVLDVNDNAPTFINPSHTVALSSEAAIGTVIANYEVSDPDEGPAGEVTFSLEGENTDHFNIDNGGTLTVLKSLKDLPDKITLMIIANDGGRPSSRSEHLLEIELYSESSGPVFKESEYNGIVPVDAKRGDFVAHIVAGIGNFTYNFESK